MKPGDQIVGERSNGLGSEIMSSRQVKLRERVTNFWRDPDWFTQKEKQFAQQERDLEVKKHNLEAKEEGIYKSDLWANLVIGDYNPDKIGVETYRKMEEYDAQVKTGLEILEMGVMVPWEIQHPDPAVVEFVTWCLNRIRKPTFLEALREIMTAVWAGYSVTESVWEYIPDQHKYALRRELGLKTLDPETIKFVTAQNGQLLKVIQTVPGSTPSYLDTQRLIVYSYGKKFGNWYGESILRGCYKEWFIKDNMLKFANIAFERFGAPIMLGIAADVKSMENVEEALTHLYARSVGTIWKRSTEDPTDIKILESKRASMPFMEYINYLNRMILQRMLVGESLLRGGGGVYGPKITFSILSMRYNEIRTGVSSALSDLVDLIVDVNFDTKVPAKIVLGPMPQEEIIKETEKAMERIEDVPGVQ